jgi:hypothetical protein
MTKRPVQLAKGGGNGIQKAARSIKVGEGLTGEKADDGDIRAVLKIHKVPVTDANVAAVRAALKGGK